MRIVVHLRALAAWWLGLFGLWELLVGEWNRSDVAFGAAAAAVTAGLTELARTRAGVRLRVPARVLRDTASLPLVLVADFTALAHALAHRREGGQRRVPLRPEAKEAGGRALVAYLATISPNAYVVEAGDDGFLFHEVVPSRRSESPA